VDCGGSEKTGKRTLERSEREGAPNPKRPGTVVVAASPIAGVLTYVVEFERAENLRGLWESAGLAEHNCNFVGGWDDGRGDCIDAAAKELVVVARWECQWW
jgi:hypothetical protein